MKTTALPALPLAEESGNSGREENVGEHSDAQWSGEAEDRWGGGRAVEGVHYKDIWMMDSVTPAVKSWLLHP